MIDKDALLNLADRLDDARDLADVIVQANEGNHISTPARIASEIIAEVIAEITSAIKPAHVVEG